MPAPLDRRQLLVLESVRRFLRRGAFAHLLNLLAKTRPQDFAPLYEEMTEREQVALFRALAERDPELGAAFLVELAPGSGPALLRRLGPQGAARLLERCADDDAADLLTELEQSEQDAILEAMRPEEKAGVEQLLIFDEETAGRIMTPEVFALRERCTVGEAIRELQTRGSVEMAFYVYVIDERNHLVGVLSLRDLLLHPPETRLSEIMNTDLITVRTDTDQEEVARIAAKYDLIAIPVLDDQGKLVGMVTIDDVIDVLREEATEDIFRMAGTSEEERIEPSIWKSVRTRSPWLVATFCGGMLASFVISGFQPTLQRIVGLAAFIPIVLGMGGSAGNQTAIVVIRGLATGRIHEGVLLRSFLRELGVSVVLGGVYGLLLAAGSFASLHWLSEMPASAALPVALVVGSSLAMSMTVATFVGSVLPLVLHRLGIDPAISTTPFVTTTTDVVGSLIFLGLATTLLAAL